MEFDGLWHRYKPSSSSHHELRSKFDRVAKVAKFTGLKMSTTRIVQLVLTPDCYASWTIHLWRTLKKNTHVVIMLSLSTYKNTGWYKFGSNKRFVFAKIAKPIWIQHSLNCESTLGATGTAAKPRFWFRQRWRALKAKQSLAFLEQQYVKYMV